MSRELCTKNSKFTCLFAFSYIVLEAIRTIWKSFNTGVDRKFVVHSISTRKGRLDLMRFKQNKYQPNQGENDFSSTARKAPHF